MTTSSGEKFGKSAGNAVFIDSNLTTPYQMYQYFINVPDDIVGKLLKVFTLLPLNVVKVNYYLNITVILVYVLLNVF